jgi:hypothetical protein
MPRKAIAHAPAVLRFAQAVTDELRGESTNPARALSTQERAWQRQGCFKAAMTSNERLRNKRRTQ